MIVTITCNPAIDKTIIDGQEYYEIGGKGINVSKFLKCLNEDSLAFGFVGRDNKELLINDLNKLGIKHHFIEVEGKIRTNTKRIIKQELYEENEKGPEIKDENVKSLFEYLEKIKDETVLLCGSCSRNIYYDLVKILKRNNNYVIVDCDRDLLVDSIKAGVDCIKPNRDEVCRYFNIEYDEELIVDKLKKLNLALVCLSLGSQGAIFIDKDEVYKIKALDVDYVSALGCGDGLCAGIAYGIKHHYEIEDIIKLSMALASLKCETNVISDINIDMIKRRISTFK